MVRIVFLPLAVFHPQTDARLAFLNMVVSAAGKQEECQRSYAVFATAHIIFIPVVFLPSMLMMSV